MVCVRALYLEWYAGLQSSIPFHTERHAHTPNVMLPHNHTNVFTFLTNFKISNFNKEYMSSLKMI